MKNVINFYLLILLLITQIHSQMTVEKRQSLINKVAKKLEIKQLDSFNSIQFYNRGAKEIKYDPTKIKEIINKYSFPEKYNYFESNSNSIIKNQGSCGGCWAFASTTSLSYRFRKLGIDVNLSPQHLISCHIKTCDNGDFLINTQLYLVKNGTVTEGCFPFTSDDGKIEECPTKCKNGEEYKKYYAKNAYAIAEEYNEENYYDIVAVVMDQLVNFGPIATSISVYEDFYLLQGESCKDKIYKYNGVSKFRFSHAVVIVGYGYENSKYYWIVQNSWGSEFCDNGLAKVEFGQIGVEQIKFAEPYIEKNSTTKEIPTKLILNDNCKLKFNTDLEDTEEDYFEMTFKGIESPKNEFYYQCGINTINNKIESVCTYNLRNLFNYKGYYQYNNYQPLKKKKYFYI